MKIAVMQPYFLPYIGYFSLIHAVDAFVFYTDVQFVRRSWMSRNRILSRQSKQGWEYIHIPVKKIKQETPLSQIQISENMDWRIRFRNQMTANYSKAPYYEPTMEWWQTIDKMDQLAEFTMQSLRSLCKALGLRTTFYDSRELRPNQELPREERLIDFANQLGAKTYINALGGQELYDKKRWEKKGIQLLFLKSGLSPYAQGGQQPFVPALSIVDILMWTSAPKTFELLAHDYTLV